MQHTFDESIVSDLHKDAYGFRPSGDWWARWRGMDADSKQIEWEYMCREVEREEIRHRAAQQRSLDAWSSEMHRLAREQDQPLGEVVRRDMVKLGADGDVGYYCFLHGISHGEEGAIRDILEAQHA